MALCFLALFLYALFILWCLSDNFRTAVLDRLVLRKLKSRIKESFWKIKVADLGFEGPGCLEDKKIIKDVLISEMEKINEDYKFYMRPINDHIKTCKIFKFIYIEKFNECIETVSEFEKQCNDLLARNIDKL